MSMSTRWAFNISKWEPTEKEFLLAISCLQIEEKNRIDKFVFKKDVKASLVGRLMIRKFIKENTNLPYNAIYLSRDANNKPVYINSDPKIPKISFNVSHHGSYTVLAGEVGIQKIGVDVMNLEYKGEKTLNEFFRIMNKNFSESEWQKIKCPTISEHNQIATFYRNWALKESFVKAIGIGLTINLSQINFNINSELQKNKTISDTSLFINNRKQSWIFEESLLDPHHCVAVAIEQQNYIPQFMKNNIFKTLRPTELLENAVSLLPLDFEFCKRYYQKESV